MKYLVNAVIVTCNRCDLLKQAIAALQNQTYRLNRIVVVNNASTDGTKEYLDGIIDDRVFVVNKEINEGGAGGFFYGMKEAYQLGCDFVWIMDDDTICAQDALENLLMSYEIVQDRPVGFIASNVLFKDGTPCFMNICRPDYVWSEFVESGIVKITHCSFVAMLVPSWVIKDVGFPIKEYFIWGDDGEYSTRILQKYEGYLSGKSHVYHYMNANVGVDIWNIEKNRISRFFYFYRNWMCTHLMRSKKDARRFEIESKQLIKEIKKSNTNYKTEKIKAIKKGIRAGKKFDIKIVYAEDKKENIEVDTDLYLRKGVFKLLRKPLIRYDIKTDGAVTYCKNLYKKYLKINPSKFRKLSFLCNGLFRTRLYENASKGVALYALLKNVDIKLCSSDYFAYSIDVYKTWKIIDRQMANCPIDYELLIKNPLKDLVYKDVLNDFQKENNSVIEGIENYIRRLINATKRSQIKNKSDIVKRLESIFTSKATTIEDALQRVLLINQIMWQTRHIQIGLGRIDLYLAPFVSDDISDEYLDSILKDFVSILHNYYWLKSEEMPGDTGQIMVIGGIDTTGNVVENRVTMSLLRVIKNLNIPDPKILLRVSEKTSDLVWKLALECIATGNGSPLISNDEIVINKLIEFGYDENDAANYVTSACWEPIPGGACEQNNIGVFDWSIPLDLVGKKEDLETIDNWDDFVWKYSIHLCGHVEFMAHLTDQIKWEKDPVLSSFNENCRKSNRDISEGGCKYNNYGILSVGLANAVNSLININKFVYQDKKISLKELYLARNKNFVGYDEIYAMFNNAKKYFGSDDTEIDVIGLTNWLIARVNETISGIRNCFNGMIKFGLSSPGFVIMGKNNAATFDGRRDGEPYSIHISSDDNANITSLLNFASRIDYGKHGFNGNVVDFTMTPMFISDNREKFLSLLKASVRNKVFQIQMNVIDSATLISAKENPDKFPNLIVRVWGFSAYFKDLSPEYQDYIIERALKYEATNN